MIIKKSYHFLILFLFAGIWITQGQKNPVQKHKEELALDTLVRIGKLENGFTYYLRNNNLPDKTIEFRMVVKAGNYHEDEDQLGYAHLLEHMGAESTKHFPDTDEFSRTEGRYSNAATGNDFTSYFVRIPSGDKEVSKNSLQLVRDWAQDISLEQKLIDIERGAVLGEMRSINPQRDRKFNEIKNIVGGISFKHEKKKANIENFNRGAYLRYYRDWYRPDLQAAIIVGDFNLDSMEVEIRSLFSDLKMPGNPKNAQNRVEAAKVNLNGKNRYVTVVDTLQPNLEVAILSKRLNPGYAPKTRADYKNIITQKLYRNIIDSRGKMLSEQFNPPYSTFTSNFGSSNLANGQLHSTTVIMGLENNNLNKMKNDFMDGLKAWKQIHNEFTILELEKAKDQVERNFSSNYPITIQELAKKYMDHFVKDATTPNPELKQLLIMELLEEIKLKDVQDFANESIKLNKNTDYIFFTRDEDAVPEEDVVRQWVAEVQKMKVKPLEVNKAIVSLGDAAKIPIAAENNNLKEISENLIGVTTINLENGIKILLKPSKPALTMVDQMVSIHAYRPNKFPNAKREEYLTSTIVPEVMRYTGAGSFTKFELERFMLDKGIRVRFETNRDSQIITGESKIGDVEEMMNLLYLYVTQPRKDPEGFAAWKASKVEEFNGISIRGSSEFYMDEIRALWYPEVPRLKKEDLDQLTVEKVFQAYKRWYSEITDYTFVVTGDFDKNILLPKLINTLAAFPVKKSIPGYRKSVSKFPLKKLDKTIRLMNTNQAYVSLYFPVTAPRDIKTQVELRLLAKAFGEKIWDRLRDGVYVPAGSGEWVDTKNEVYKFWVRFDSELGNENNLVQMALEEFRRLKQEGVDQDWLEKAISEEKIAYGGKLDRYSLLFPFWQDYLKEKLQNGEDLQQEVLQYKTVLEHFITVEDVNAAAKKYMSEENFQKFLLIPEAYNPVQ